MSKPQKYPIDFSTIHKGMSIPKESIIKISGFETGEPEYGFFLMRFRKQIMDYMETQSTPVTAKIEDYGIRVLTDSEAAIYNKREFNSSMRSMERSHKRNMNVDPTNLSSEEKPAWQRSIIEQSFIVQSVQHAKKQIRIEGYKRKTPEMLE